MICCCGIEEEDDNEKKWEVLRIIQSTSCQNGIISCQHVRYTQDESCCVKMQVAGDFPSPEMCNKSV
jgi:hypothetical protein